VQRVFVCAAFTPHFETKENLMAIDGNNSGGAHVGGADGHNKPGTDGAGKITDRVHHAVDQVSDRASDIAARTRSGMEGRMHDVGAFMKRRPLTSIALGVGFGYLLAKFRGRS
jgi:hypothetical protein